MACGPITRASLKYKSISCRGKLSRNQHQITFNPISPTIAAYVLVIVYSHILTTVFCCFGHSNIKVSDCYVDICIETLVKGRNVFNYN